MSARPPTNHYRGLGETLRLYRTLSFAGFGLRVQLLGSKAMLRNPQITVEEVAAQLGASALYKHLPGGCSSALDGQKS